MSGFTRPDDLSSPWKVKKTGYVFLYINLIFEQEMGCCVGNKKESEKKKDTRDNNYKEDLEAPPQNQKLTEAE